MSSSPEEDFENAKAICSNLGLPEPVMTNQTKVGRMCPHDNKLPDGTCPLCAPKADEIARKLASDILSAHCETEKCLQDTAKRIEDELNSYANAVSEQRVKEAIGKLICCSRGCFNANEDAIRSLKREPS